jgi:hypothetical protein
MRQVILTALLAMSPAAFAQAQQAAPQQAAPQNEATGSEHGSEHGMDSAQMEKMKAERLQRVSDALNLDAAGKAKVKTQLDNFHVQNKPLFDKMKSDMDTIHAASTGDTAAAAKVSATITDLRSVRTQLMKHHDALFDQIAKGRTNEEKAKLVLAFMPEHMEHAPMGTGGSSK